MRTSSIVISALLGAGAIAHPTLRGLHLHHKRAPAELIHSWDEGNTHFEEYESTTTVVLPAGQQAPSTTEQQPAVEDKHVTTTSNNNNHNNDNQQQQAQKQQAQPQQAQQQQAQPQQAQQQQAQPQQAQQQQAQPQQAQPQAQQQAAYSPPEHHEAAQPTTSTTPSGGDSGNTVLDSFNKLRGQWDSSLKAYTWDTTLAANAAKTAKDNNGASMNHELLAGSNAQCIAEGSDGSGSNGRSGFEQAAAMWMCEKPAGSLDCGAAKNSNGDTGHADIIKSGSYSTVGCAYLASTTGGTATGDGQKGIWVCDYH